MKKLLTITIILLLFSINVDAKVNIINYDDEIEVHYWNLFLNDIEYKHTVYSHTTEYKVIIKYYNNNNELISEGEPEYRIVEKENGSKDYYFKFDNNYSRIWKVKNTTHDYDYTHDITTYELVPFEIAEDADIYFIGHRNEIVDIDLIVKDGDIILHEESYSRLNYLDMDYYQPGDDLYYYVVGYDENGQKINDNYSTYIFNSTVGSSVGSYMGLIGYIEPEFRVECENNSIKKNEATMCTLKVRTKYNLNEIDIDTSNINFQINNIAQNDSFVVDKNDNLIKVYRKEYKDLIDRCSDVEEYNENSYLFCITHDEIVYLDNILLDTVKDIDLFTFNVTSNEDIDTNKLNVLFDISYNLVGIRNTDQAKEEINIIQINDTDNIVNPETGYRNIAILMLVTCLFSGLLFYIVRKQELMDEI